MALTSMPVPIMVPMQPSGACSVMMLNMSGSAMPVPMPSSTRPHRSIGKLTAHMPQMMPAT